MKKEFYKGVSWGWCSKRGEYSTPEAKESLKLVRESGCDWISICFYALQEQFSSTKIYFDYESTPTDPDIICAIENARKNNLKICLKPIVNCADGVWRARIGFPDVAEGEQYWNAWFKSYRAFIRHYAEIAEKYQVELFCIGCEMVNTEYRVEDWTALIASVRAIYSGKVTYNIQHDCKTLYPWLEKLDIIGMSAYYPVGRNGNDVASMKKEWLSVLPQLSALSKRFNKPIMFIEIGCQSAVGASVTPWNAESDQADQDEQANFYQSALEVFFNEDWFAGYFWWDWPAILYSADTASSNIYFSPYGKKANDIMAKFYLMPAE